MSTKVDALIVDLASKDLIDGFINDIKRVSSYNGIEIDEDLEKYIRNCFSQTFLYGAIWQLEGGRSGDAKKYGLED